MNALRKKAESEAFDWAVANLGTAVVSENQGIVLRLADLILAVEKRTREACAQREIA